MTKKYKIVNLKSKIEWVNNSAIDRQKWDKCIDTCHWGKVYAISWYLDYLTENCWGALIIGDYEYIMPVPFRVKLGIKYAYRPNFCQQLGVFSKTNSLPQDVLESFINELLKKFKHIHYPFNHSNIFKNRTGLKFQKRTNLLLKLNQSYETLFQNYSGNLKKNLKTAESENLFIKDKIGSELVIDLYKTAWQKLNSIHEKDYSNFKKLVDYTAQQGMAETIGVYKGDALLAACVLLKHKNRLYYPFSAISKEGRKYSATAFLINSIIKRYSNTYYHLDFEGSDIESVKSFYQKFRPEEEYYFQLDKTIPLIGKLAKFVKGIKNK